MGGEGPDFLAPRALADVELWVFWACCSVVYFTAGTSAPSTALLG